MTHFYKLTLFALASMMGLINLRVTAEEEILVGASSGGMLQVKLDFAQPITLDPSIFPGISGFATGEVGMHSNIIDDPTQDFFQLSIGADFRLILLAKDPGMEVWNDSGSGYLGLNESFYIGVPPFDNHPLWNLVRGTPGNTYSLTLKLHDVNNIYADSSAFVLSFTPPQVLPRLGIRILDSSQATLSWTTNAVGWEPQYAATLTAGDWHALTNAPVLAATNYSLTITTSETQRYFRLAKKP